MRSQSFDIPISTIIKVVLTLGALALLWAIRDIIALIIFAVIIASAVSPAVDHLQEKRRVPRVAGAILIYFTFIAFLGFALWIIIPTLAGQFADMAQALPGFVSNIPLIVDNTDTISDALGNIQASLPEIGPRIGEFFGNFFSGTLSVFGSLASVLITFVLAFYLSVEDQGIKKILRITVPKKHHRQLFHAVEKAQKTFAAWIKGQFSLALIVGVLTYIGLRIIGVEFPLVLALIVALLEFIPYVGPPLAAIPAVIIAFATGGVFTGSLTVVLYIIVQQIENNLLAPLIMRKAVGLDPLLVIIALLIGAKLAGIMGMILAVPLAAFGMQMLQDKAGYDFKPDYQGKAPKRIKRFTVLGKPKRSKKR